MDLLSSACNPARVGGQALGFPVSLPVVPSSPRDMKVGESAVEAPEPFQSTLRVMWSARGDFAAQNIVLKASRIIVPTFETFSTLATEFARPRRRAAERTA